jgi:hypothetical protein
MWKRGNQFGEEGKFDPCITMREGFNWVEEDQLPDIIRQITTPQSTSPVEANRKILELLLERNPSVENRKIGSYTRL